MAGQLHFKFGKTFRYQASCDSLLGRGGCGMVFVGDFKRNLYKSWEDCSDEGEKAAIKRVEINFKRDNWMDIGNDREFVALKELRHPCIVSLLAVEDDDNFRNYIFEFCQASLEDFISKKYDGPMPDETEGLYQMASGLKFIHEKKMIHRDIKPENVLIYLPEMGQRAMLKISDFGFTKPLKADGVHYDLASGLKGTEYYMAPELLVLRNLTGRVLDKECTIASDVFAAGCTFFRYLNGGLHPFGENFDIEVNIVNGDPINAASKNSEYVGDPWKTDLFAKMVKFSSEERPTFLEIVELLLKHHLDAQCIQPSLPPALSGEAVIVVVEQNEKDFKTVTTNVGDVQYDRSNVVGTGGYGVVYAGTFKGEKVAVKRIDIMRTCDNRELANNKILLNHSNIVQFKHYEEDGDFRYFILELCAASLRDYIDGKYEGPMPTDEQVLFQLTNGLEYIHSKKLVHREVKPTNVVISITNPVQMKYCDFGFSQKVNDKGACTVSKIRGSPDWFSPEELRVRYGGTSEKLVYLQSDIFSAGCVFIYFLLRGKHPFGDQLDEIPNNIRSNNHVNVKELSANHFARPFVLQMIENKPEKRISLREVIDYLKPLQPANRLSLLQYDNQNLLCSTGTLSLVYHVGTFEGSQLAVKRVLIKDCTTISFEELKQLHHLNIVRLLHVDQDNLFRYFGMEWCVASLDQIFLPEDDSKKYKGPTPSEEQFCFQLISGLQYIHGENLVHGSIKPTNILISSSEDHPQIKLSDFGLTTSRLNEGHSTKRLISGFLSSRYWLAPELLARRDSSGRQFTKESDIFAAGSVFFYFLSQGCHLFGDIHEITENTTTENHANIFCKLPKIVFPTGLIRWMTSKAPGDRPKMDDIKRHLNLIKPLPNTGNLKKIGGIQYSAEHFVEGGGQANVFIGKWENSEVAVKRIGNIDTLTPEKKKLVYRERDNYLLLKDPNIVKLLSSDENDLFLALALEKCLISLHDYCCVPQLYHGIVPMPSDQEVLLQMAHGLHYIHSQGLIHRDVKPKNILISHNNPAVIKWADFGMSRTVITGSKTFSWSKLQGTDRWLAPELIAASREQKITGSQKCDIFALGCVFFFFLVSGVHPFGEGDDEHSTQTNIKNNNRVNFHRLPKEHFAFHIVHGMIENDTEKRSRLPDLVEKLSTIASVNVLKVDGTFSCL